MNRVRRLALCRTTTTVFAFGMALAAALNAQDTRTVKEPAIPPVCDTLKSSLTAANASSGEIEAHANKPGSVAGLDTARIQRAINRCDKGHAVELASDGPSAGFLTGPLALRPGVTLLIDKDVTLYATRNPETYALTPGSCGVVDDAPPGCKPLISVQGATGSAIMGDGVIDGQGGAQLIVDGQPSPKSWWDLADQAHTAGNQQAPRMVDTDLSDDFTLYRITLRNSPSLQVAFHRGEGFTVWGVKIDTPKSARNTDGIRLEQAKNITITQSFLRTGEDDIGIHAGDGPTSGISISHNHIYWGRGLSIGGETNSGVSQVRVDDLSLDGSDYGIHIHSDAGQGGLVDDIAYQDICIRNSRNPLFFDTTYAFPGQRVHALPVYQNIALRNTRIAGGGRIQFGGFDDAQRISLRMDGVLLLDGEARYRSQAIHTDFTFGPGPVNLSFLGNDSTVTGTPGKGSLPPCAAKFVPFP